MMVMAVDIGEAGVIIHFNLLILAINMMIIVEATQEHGIGQDIGRSNVTKGQCGQVTPGGSWGMC